jgi:two-component system phosphate regulon sensor histidine kinase PhoR
VVKRRGFEVYVHLTSERALYAGYWRLVWWCSGIIGGAFLTALLGLWLIKRTLNKERRLGELKSQFVSSVSHELRAPIGSMRLMAEGLASGRVRGEAAGDFHRLMAGEGARLSALIENVLDFARIEQGRKEYAMAETDVAALLVEAVALMQPQAEAKGLRIVLQCEPLPFVPRIDAGAVQQAVINLLDNAVKFTAAAGTSGLRGSHQDSGGPEVPATIRVHLTAARPGWSITVTDPGPGIPAAEHARIFERFYRLGNELRRETTGTGIGLAIVKHIVEGHGGKVLVESAVGSGSAFCLSMNYEGGNPA